MANQKAVSMTVGDGLCEIMIWYNDVNNRIGNIEWNMATGFAGRVQIWDTGNLIYDQVYGSGQGAETVPGNYRMVQQSDPEFGTWMALPPELSWQFNIRTI